MVEIKISDEFASVWPDIKLSCISCDVKIDEHNPILWAKIDELSSVLRNSVAIEDISQQTAISASRKAYRAMGKDPARYRLSAEALMRRVVKGNNLYLINNVVDIVNLVSATTGFSIGGYDADRINGPVTLCIGKTDELYDAIGRGALNIEYLPVLRDQTGAFGSPTSDSVRTSVKLATQRFLMVFFCFGAHPQLGDAVELAKQLLACYASAKNFEVAIV
jgi:DNA/RNA-binding domain of Phe-tRNA-synthetase-like protein